jgi:hypothetical protein
VPAAPESEGSCRVGQALAPTSPDFSH